MPNRTKIHLFLLICNSFALNAIKYTQCSNAAKHCGYLDILQSAGRRCSFHGE